MNYNIILSDTFKIEAKRLIKKYPSLKYELAELAEQLSENPTLGIPLGNDVYKIRIAISSKNRGKSGGGRIISYVRIVNYTVYLLAIYSKGKKQNITNKEIKDLMKEDL